MKVQNLIYFSPRPLILKLHLFLSYTACDLKSDNIHIFYPVAMSLLSQSTSTKCTIRSSYQRDYLFATLSRIWLSIIISLSASVPWGKKRALAKDYWFFSSQENEKNQVPWNDSHRLLHIDPDPPLTSGQGQRAWKWSEGTQRRLNWMCSLQTVCGLRWTFDWCKLKNDSSHL